MCGDKASLNKEDAAEKLALILCDCVRSGPTAPFVHSTGVRTLIRDHWSKVAALAHQIHDEEEAKKKEIKVGDTVRLGINGLGTYTVKALSDGAALLEWATGPYSQAGIPIAAKISDLRKV